jgi:uncharacterized protein YodC (DUF2158 family)
MAFKIGDVVQLKGGGPVMTVTHIGRETDGSQNVTCTWFDRHQVDHQSAYNEAA